MNYKVDIREIIIMMRSDKSIDVRDMRRNDIWRSWQNILSYSAQGGELTDKRE